MATIYIKSALILTGTIGFAYVLMRITEPSSEKIAKIRASRYRPVLEDEIHKELLVARLKEATYGKTAQTVKKEDSEK